MSTRVTLTHLGDGFYPPMDAPFVHENREYKLEVLMQIEAYDGKARSTIQAMSTDQKSILQFLFVVDLTTNEQAEDNVLLMRPPQAVRA